MSKLQAPCWLLLASEDAASGEPSRSEQTELQKELESNDVNRKIPAMRRLVKLVVNGVQLPNLVMTVIRYCVTTTNHQLKKLLLLYWESVNKMGDDGNLRPEMVLVINALLSDLIHANEYIRGCTLRFLCHIGELGLISHLIEPVKVGPLVVRMPALTGRI